MFHPSFLLSFLPIYGSSLFVLNLPLRFAGLSWQLFGGTIEIFQIPISSCFFCCQCKSLYAVPLVCLCVFLHCLVCFTILCLGYSLWLPFCVPRTSMQVAVTASFTTFHIPFTLLSSTPSISWNLSVWNLLCSVLTLLLLGLLILLCLIFAPGSFYLSSSCSTSI